MGTQAATPKRVSLNPDTYIAGGLFEGDAEIIDARFTLDKPAGYTFDDRVFYYMELKSLESGQTQEQFWSAGKKENFVPSGDGHYLLECGDQRGLGIKSNAAALFTSMVSNAGMPKNKLDEEGGVSLLIGAKLHFIQSPAPETGLEQKAGKTISTVSKAIHWPWERATGRGRAGRSAAGAVATQPALAGTQAGAGEGDELAVKLLGLALQKAGGILELNQVKAQVFRECTPLGIKLDQRNQVLALVMDEDWLAANGFEVSGGSVMAKAS
jgi:hypothetical protein